MAMVPVDYAAILALFMRRNYGMSSLGVGVGGDKGFGLIDIAVTGALDGRGGCVSKDYVPNALVRFPSVN